MCTPWDAPSVQALADYGIPALKIASADLTNHELIADAADKGLPLVLSTGMSRESEILETVALLRREGRALRAAALPVDVPGALQGPQPALSRPSGRDRPVRGRLLRARARLACAGRSVARGARTSSRKHFTIDRTMEGQRPPRRSLLPDEFWHHGRADPRHRDVDGISATIPRSSHPYAAEPRDPGEVAGGPRLAHRKPRGFTAADVVVKSPGGAAANALPQLLGPAVARHGRRRLLRRRPARRGPDGRPFAFRRPWGLPVRYHDAGRSAGAVEPGLPRVPLRT
jgi:N-acetylneuraminate synthase